MIMNIKFETPKIKAFHNHENKVANFQSGMSFYLRNLRVIGQMNFPKIGIMWSNMIPKMEEIIIPDRPLENILRLSLAIILSRDLLVF